MEIQNPSFAPPAKKKGCLRSCLVGLFVLLFLLAGAFTGLYYVFRGASFPIPSPSTTAILYQERIRPKILEELPRHLSAEEKTKVMELFDSGMEKFQALPEDERRVLLKEFAVASYYYSRNQIIPPEKIDHLRAFVEKHVEAYRLEHPLNR